MDNEKSEKPNKLSYLKYLVYLVPIVVILVGYGAITVVTAESNPFTIVTGTSMEPTILAGTVAVISKVPFDQLQRGDVIVFVPQVALQQPCDSSPGGSLTEETSVPCFVIHRIVSINTDSSGNTYLTTKGDNNEATLPGYDTHITSSMYIGKVVLQLPYVGYLTETPYNEYAAGLILFALISQLLWERKSSRKKHETSTT